VDDVVLVKTFAQGVLGRTADELPGELELASRLHHDNIVRTLAWWNDEGNDFVVTEYLEGITLRRLLEWLDTRGENLADAALVRVLLGVFAAVEHATRCAVTPHARMLVCQLVAADDVFITCKGDVKLLGFKPGSRLDGAADGAPTVHRAAVDALLATRQSPELSRVLASVDARLAPSSALGSWRAGALQSWQVQTLGSDGRVELAALMATRLPEGRATRRARLEAACARVRQVLAHEGSSAPTGGPQSSERRREPPDVGEEEPPASGVGTIGVRSRVTRSALAGAEAVFSPRAGELALRSESSLPERLQTLRSLAVELPPRSGAWLRPPAIDTPANEGGGVLLLWLAVAIAAGAAAAFGVHQLTRVPHTPAALTHAAPAPAAAALITPLAAAASVAGAPIEGAQRNAALVDSATGVVAPGDTSEWGVTPGDSEAAANDPAPPARRSTTSRWQLSVGEARGDRWRGPVDSQAR
jgi:hypothetical protein